MNLNIKGLARAIESKYNVSATAIRYLYRRNAKGITAKLDDDLLKFYCNEDTFLMQVSPRRSYRFRFAPIFHNLPKHRIFFIAQ